MKLIVTIIALLALVGCASQDVRMREAQKAVDICDNMGGTAYLTQGLSGPRVVCRLPKQRCTYGDFFDNLEY